MNSIINTLKAKPLSGNEIFNACGQNIKIMRYSEFIKFNIIDEAFEPYSAIAILYEMKPAYGHWVLLLRHDNKHLIEYMDSYGLFIDEPLKYINNDFKKQTNQDKPYLSLLLHNSDYNISVNNIKIQNKNKNISSCGRHLCLRYILRDIPLKKYISIITSDDKNTSDDIVTYLTAFI